MKEHLNPFDPTKELSAKALESRPVNVLRQAPIYGWFVNKAFRNLDEKVVRWFATDTKILVARR